MTNEPKEKESNYFGVILISVILIIVLWGMNWLYASTWIADGKQGYFGDMFGAVNALFSGLAFAGIIYTILLQRQELKLQRKELRDTRQEFTLQNMTLKMQRFENTFFNLLSLHNEIKNSLELVQTNYKYKGSEYFFEWIRQSVGTMKLSDATFKKFQHSHNVTHKAFDLSMYLQSLHSIFTQVNTLKSQDIDPTNYLDILRNSISKNETIFLFYYYALSKNTDTKNSLLKMEKELNLISRLNPTDFLDEAHFPYLKPIIKGYVNVFEY